MLKFKLSGEKSKDFINVIYLKYSSYRLYQIKKIMSLMHYVAEFFLKTDKIRLTVKSSHIFLNKFNKILLCTLSSSSQHILIK